MESPIYSGKPVEHKYNTRSKINKKVINYKELEGDSGDDTDSEDELDPVNFQEFLALKFPSKYMKSKLAATKAICKNKKKPSCNIIINKANILQGKKNKIINSEYDDESDDEDSDLSNLYELVMNGEDTEDNSDDEENEYDDEDSEEDEDDDDMSEDSDDEDSSDEAEDLNNKFKSLSKKLLNRSNYSNDLIKNIAKLANKKKKRKSKKDDEKVKEAKKIKANVKEFQKLLSNDDNLNDISYFKKQLNVEQQNTVIEKFKTISASYKIDKPYRLLLLETDIPNEFKITALKKISMLENMDPSVSEYFKLKNWIDTFMRIPFNNVENFPVTLTDGMEACNKYMQNAVEILDKAVYGLNDAKMQIMQLFGQWIVNPGAVGSAIAIKGPMGTGKTTLVKHGISKALNRPFALIALGGATDASVLEGHGYTYEGSTWGKIVEILIQTKCQNPIIFFDELDKVSDTPKGEEIIGILTHLIDATQNNQFHDKYFSEIDFDLSKALFIFSYNDESKINPILRDRMYRITTKGYTAKDKVVIAKDYLLPNLFDQIKFKKDDINLADDVIQHIIEQYTEKEDGVRNLKRCLEIIFTKLNLYRLMTKDSNLFKDEKTLEVVFPYTITREVVDKLIKKEFNGNENWRRMYM